MSWFCVGCLLGICGFMFMFCLYIMLGEFWGYICGFGGWGIMLFDWFWLYMICCCCCCWCGCGWLLYICWWCWRIISWFLFLVRGGMWDVFMCGIWIWGFFDFRLLIGGWGWCIMLFICCIVFWGNILGMFGGWGIFVGDDRGFMNCWLGMVWFVLFIEFYWFMFIFWFMFIRIIWGFIFCCIVGYIWFWGEVCDIFRCCKWMFGLFDMGLFGGWGMGILGGWGIGLLEDMEELLL